MHPATHYMRTPLYQTILLVFLSATTSLGQKTTVYKYVHKGTKTSNYLISSSDTILIGEHISSAQSLDRSIFWRGNRYRFKRNASTKLDEILMQDSVLLGTSGGANTSFFTVNDSVNRKYLLKKNGGKEWSYWVNDKMVLTGVYKSDTGEKAFEILAVDETNPGFDMALLLSFAYATEIIHAQKMKPMYIGLIVGGVLLRALMTATAE